MHSYNAALCSNLGGATWTLLGEAPLAGLIKFDGWIHDESVSLSDGVPIMKWCEMLSYAAILRILEIGEGIAQTPKEKLRFQYS